MKKYRSANGLDELIISHSETRRNRRTVRLNRTIVTADPFIPANNVEVSYSAYLVIDEPVTGFTDAEITADLDTTDGLLWWLGSGTVMADLLAGES